MQEWKESFADKLTAYFLWEDLERERSKIFDQAASKFFSDNTTDLEQLFRERIGIGAFGDLNTARSVLIEMLIDAPVNIQPETFLCYQDGSVYQYSYRLQFIQTDFYTGIHFLSHSCQNINNGEEEEFLVHDLNTIASFNFN